MKRREGDETYGHTVYETQRLRRRVKSNSETAMPRFQKRRRWRWDWVKCRCGGRREKARTWRNEGKWALGYDYFHTLETGLDQTGWEWAWITNSHPLWSRKKKQKAFFVFFFRKWLIPGNLIISIINRLILITLPVVFKFWNQGT